MGSKQAGKFIDIIIEVPKLLHKHMLVIGDFNLHHIDCDNCMVNSTIQTKIFANWIANKNAMYELEVDIVTYARDRIPDLVIASNLVLEQETKCYMEPNLHVTSNHETILTYLKIRNPDPKKTSQRRF